MQNKIITAKLREPITVAVQMDASFTEDWLQASAVVEQLKRNLFHELRQKMHEKVATLSLDDLDFKITS